MSILRVSKSGSFSGNKQVFNLLGKQHIIFTSCLEVYQELEEKFSTARTIVQRPLVILTSGASLNFTHEEVADLARTLAPHLRDLRARGSFDTIEVTHYGHLSNICEGKPAGDIVQYPFNKELVASLA